MGESSDSLCRLCASTSYCINIFGEAGMSQHVFSKISLCLPVKVSENDGLPSTVCLSCVAKLNTTYELYTGCLTAKEKLSTLFKNENSDALCSAKPFPSGSTSTDTPKIFHVISNKPATSNVYYTTVNGVKSTNQNIPVEIAVPVSISDPQISLQRGHIPEVAVKREAPSSTTESTSKKKIDRKTVCQFCKEWFPRSIIEDHENLHIKGGVFFSCLDCNGNFKTKPDFYSHKCQPCSKKRI